MLKSKKSLKNGFKFETFCCARFLFNVGVFSVIFVVDKIQNVGQFEIHLMFDISGFQDAAPPLVSHNVYQGSVTFRGTVDREGHEPISICK